MDEAYRLTSSALAPLSVGAIPLALIKVGITAVLLVLFYFVFARRLRRPAFLRALAEYLGDRTGVRA